MISIWYIIVGIYLNKNLIIYSIIWRLMMLIGFNWHRQSTKSMEKKMLSVTWLAFRVVNANDTNIIMLASAIRWT